MAGTRMPLQPLTLYQAYWVSGIASGTVHVWAPDARTAVRTVRDHASYFGIPHDRPLVGKAIPLTIIEEGPHDVDLRAA